VLYVMSSSVMGGCSPGVLPPRLIGSHDRLIMEFWGGLVSIVTGGVSTVDLREVPCNMLTSIFVDFSISVVTADCMPENCVLVSMATD